MSSTVQSSDKPTPVVDLGMSPLQYTLLRMAVLILVMAVLAGTAAASNGMNGSAIGGIAAFFVVIFGIPWLILMFYLGMRTLKLMVEGGGVAFNRAKAAVSAGLIDVTYFIKGQDDLVLVDEPGQRLCINGDVVGFGQVKSLNYESDNRQHRLTFALTSGANPVRNVVLQNADALRVAFERIGNSLGFK